MKTLKATVITATMVLAVCAIAKETATKVGIDPIDILEGEGDFERWSVVNTTEKNTEYYQNAIKNGWSVTPCETNVSVLIPKAFNQFCEFSPDGNGVVRKSEIFHNGKAALELEGGFYLPPEGGFPTNDLEVYSITFYVYGEKPKSPIVHATVRGDNSPSYSIESHDVENEGDGNWSKVTETIKVIGSGANRISFRLHSNALMLVDDLIITQQEK